MWQSFSNKAEVGVISIYPDLDKIEKVKNKRHSGTKLDFIKLILSKKSLVEKTVQK